MKRALKKRPPHLERLWKAVQNYVEKEGGKLVVIGDVQILKWPGDGQFNFTVGVKCTGRVPDFAKELK